MQAVTKCKCHFKQKFQMIFNYSYTVGKIPYFQCISIYFIQIELIEVDGAEGSEGSRNIQMPGRVEGIEAEDPVIPPKKQKISNMTALLGDMFQRAPVRV